MAHEPALGKQPPAAGRPELSGVCWLLRRRRVPAATATLPLFKLRQPVPSALDDGTRMSAAHLKHHTTHPSRAALHPAEVFVDIPPKELERALTGRTLVAAQRRGKQMWWDFDQGPSLLVHFGMTGGLVIKGVGAAHYKSFVMGDSTWPPRFCKMELKFEDGTQLAFCDSRRFAKVRFLEQPEQRPPISELGWDPILDMPPLDAFCTQLGQQRRAVKALLLDQSFSAGVGNWVADEVLYQARLHPEQPANSITQDQAAALYAAIKGVCELACEVEADSTKFPDTWLFHYRWGKGNSTKAKIGGHIIDHITVGGRTSAVVPAVQKLNKAAIAAAAAANSAARAVAAAAGGKPAGSSKKKRGATGSASDAAVDAAGQGAAEPTAADKAASAAVAEAAAEAAVAVAVAQGAAKPRGSRGVAAAARQAAATAADVVEAASAAAAAPADTSPAGAAAAAAAAAGQSSSEGGGQPPGKPGRSRQSRKKGAAGAAAAPVRAAPDLEVLQEAAGTGRGAKRFRGASKQGTDAASAGAASTANGPKGPTRQRAQTAAAEAAPPAAAGRKRRAPGATASTGSA